MKRSPGGPRRSAAVPARHGHSADHARESGRDEAARPGSLRADRLPHTYDNDDEVIAEINSTPYGLASGVFTHDLERALNLAQRLDVGTLHVNGTSSSRVDIMPYGGVKASGHGIEGPAFAVKDMSLETLLSLEWTS